MTGKANKSKPAAKAKPEGGNVLEVDAKDGEERELLMARIALEPGTRHAAVSSNFAAGIFSDNHQTPIKSGVTVMGDAMAQARAGDKALASNLLAAQAMALDSMFTELARRSAANLGHYIDAADRYMRLALKAQSNCRATLEALAKLHQPREQTVKHVHVNEGGQAIVADQFHQNTGGYENGKSIEQPHATGAAGESPALLGADPQGNGVPIPGCEGESTLPHARRQGQRCTEGQP
jgi:hypothetical protein